MNAEIIVLGDAPEAPTAADRHGRQRVQLGQPQKAVPGSVLHVVGQDSEFRALEGLSAAEAEELERRLQEQPPETLVLDSCWTATVGGLLSIRADVTIGIPARIGRDDAERFFSAWSQTVEDGASSENAFERAFIAIAAEDLPSDLQPVLLLRDVDSYGFRAPRRSRSITVGFGTNRMVDERGLFTSYSGRSLKGSCEVVVWSDSPIGGTSRQFARNAPFLAAHTLLDRASFTSAVAHSLDADTSNRRSVLVYVHGFNTGFREAAQRAAQLHVDLAVPGATVFFSWPSRGSADLRAYASDEDSIVATERPLYDFLAELCASPDVGRVHVLAHSMGCRAVVRAVVRAAEASTAPFELGELILAAPDVPGSQFAQVGPLLSKVAQRTTVYTSRRDRALQGSAFWHRSERVGALGPSLFADEIPAGMTFIDAQKVDISLLGHGYYAASAAVLRDISWLLFGMPLESRFGVEDIGPGRLALRAAR